MDQIEDINDKDVGKKAPWALRLLAALPLLLMALLFIINGEYVSQLWIDLPPRVGLMPCGWIVLAVIAALVVLARLVLWLAYKISWLPGTILMVAMACVLILAASFMVLLGPAAFQILRNEALRQVVG